MIMIYDFDGTLTPYSLPNYEVLSKCGYDGKSIMVEVNKIINEQSVDLYTAYYRAFRQILESNGIAFSKESICIGVDKVQFNKGILEYFNHLCFQKRGIKHYVVTSGFEDYIKETPIARYLDDVLGTNFYVVNGKYTTIKRLISNERKIEAIEEIRKSNGVRISDIVYFGDGLTDVDAFLYIHNNGGKAILVCDGGKSNEAYASIHGLGIIDECFDLDYSEDSDLYKYVNLLLKR